MLNTNYRDTISSSLINPESDIFFPVHQSHIYSHDQANNCGFHMRSPKYKVIKRTDTGEELGIHKKGYVLVRNEDLFGMVEKQLHNHLDPIVMDTVEVSDHISYLGAVCVREYRFPRISHTITTENGHSTSLQMRAIVWNCFNGSSKVRILFGNVDMFCTNGMLTGSYNLVTKKRTSGFILESIETKLIEAMSTFQLEMDTYDKWAMTRVPLSVVEDFFTSVAPKRTAEKLLEQLTEEVSTRGGNLWSVVSAMTAYASANSERFPLRDMKNDNESAMLFERQVTVNKWMSSSEWEALTNSYQVENFATVE